MKFQLNFNKFQCYFNVISNQVLVNRAKVQL